MTSRRVTMGVLLLLALATGCGQRAASPAAANRLQVVATTTIVGDVVRQIGGDAVDVTVLLPVGADPHAFEPTPQDAARIAGARAIFASGAGLEQSLERFLASTARAAETVYLSEGIALRQLDQGQGEGEHAHEGEADPHVWTDPNNVAAWTHRIEDTLARLDAQNAGRYHANAEAYRGQLQALDAWVREQVAQVPPANRKLVVDHEAWGYFADRYGFEQIGTVIPGFSTLAEPSAQDLAALEDAIRAQGVKAVFVGTTVNPSLARRVASDTGASLVTLYTGSLTAPGGEADTYLAYMRHNVSAIVQALK